MLGVSTLELLPSRANGMTSEEKPVDELLLRNPELRRNLADHSGTWMLLRGGVLNIYGELNSADAERIGGQAKLELIQFGRKFDVSNATLRLLNDHVLAQHPQASLRETLNGFGAFDDLGFLGHLPGLRSLGIDGNHAIDLRPIRSHGALEHLSVGGLGTSLSPLQGYERLRSFAFGERIKHHEAVGTFTNLERLTINGQNLKSLTFLKPLQSLRSLSFVLGGTRRFADLPDLPRLDELSIWRTRKLEIDDLLPLNQISSLRRLVLSELPRITSLDWLTNSSLHILELEKMKGLRSYASLVGLPSLKTLILRDEVTEGHIVELARLGSLKEIYVHEYYQNELRAVVDARSLPLAIKAISFRQGEAPPSNTPVS
jgi:hypothetical protein